MYIYVYLYIFSVCLQNYHSLTSLRQNHYNKSEKCGVDDLRKYNSYLKSIIRCYLELVFLLISNICLFLLIIYCFDFIFVVCSMQSKI